MGQLKAGVIYGVTSWKMQCRNCGYQGQPLIFDTKEEYGKFLEALKQSGTSPAPVPDTEEEKPDERIVDLLKNTKETETAAEVPSKSWRREIIVSLVVAAIVTLIEAPSAFFQLGAVATLYLVFFFVLATVVVLVIFIVIEYIARKTRRGSMKKQGES
jgi:hypothetical protein